ncbi:hemerythrin domain-containing protein [Kibdelosporangium persicum]|uniref:Hemerythrin HHE cation binding domain-containing protein n=1 Tax=Kibdelosporangium persicum TaxID=2698649 RepID=A0ABX2FG08_9PSEU|nr:hemerythrin domain-containing protein [Kibdelosporangium persicum]NRN70313.1 Hemerythrin HHE cation binding domain-containing protein [Kibdelosporangium persicum]
MDSKSRIAAFGTQLIEVHDWLREQLARLRADLESGNAQPRKLQAHCLTFCQAITKHHTGEDSGAFPVLARQFPELRPVLDELTRDHEVITVMLRRLDSVDFADKATALRELNGVEAIVESHFTYEERKIIDALNTLDNPEWDGEFLDRG